MGEDYLKKKIKDVVVTIPIYYNKGQRQAVKEAAKKVGLNVLHLLHVTSAAAVSYGTCRNHYGPENILTFDFGGGSCVASIFRLDNNKYVAKASNSNSRLGGNSVDASLLKIVVDKISSIQGTPTDCVDINSLKEQVQKTKHRLSNELVARCFIPFIGAHKKADPYIKVTRDEFDKMNVELYKDILQLLKHTLRDARMEAEDIDEIVMVGGSSRIPAVQNIMKTLFKKRDVPQYIHLDEALAQGASYLAEMLLHPDRNDLTVIDDIQTTNEYQAKMVNNFTLFEILGKGAFGTVRKGRNREGELVAIKCIDGSFEEETIKKELDVASHISNHVNIVSISEHFMYSGIIYIVMELCKCDLNHHVIDQNPGIKECVEFMKDMAIGLKYLHNHNVVHRDIKPQNIVLKQSLNRLVCKIADFGLSKIQTEDRFLQTLCGTPMFSAPEIVYEMKKYKSSVDIFSLGLVYFAFTTTERKTAYDVLISKYEDLPLNLAIFRNIISKETFLEKHFRHCKGLGKIILGMISKEPDMRTDLDSVLIGLQQQL